MDSFRMPIIDRYRDMGTIIMGKSEAGVVKKGDTLLIMPNRCEHLPPLTTTTTPPPIDNMPYVYVFAACCDEHALLPAGCRSRW